MFRKQWREVDPPKAGEGKATRAMNECLRTIHPKSFDQKLAEYFRAVIF